jgi:hypothetical protein
MKEKAPYGSWRSFVSASLVAEAASRPGDLVVDGLDIYIGESRPEESGRVAIVKRNTGNQSQAEDVLPAPFSARSRVHEYGGGSFNVRAGSLVFVNDSDQALYLRGPGERPRRLSPLSTRSALDPRTLGLLSGCSGCPPTARCRTGTSCAPSPRAACGSSAC